MLATLLRGRNLFLTTVMTVRVSLAALRAQLPVDIWQILHQLAPGLLMSRNWTRTFARQAIQYRPPASYETMPRVGACMFDNYARKIQYTSQWTTDSSGYRLDMTNYCSMAVPRQLFHAFDAQIECMPPPLPP